MARISVCDSASATMLRLPVKCRVDGKIILQPRTKALPLKKHLSGLPPCLLVKQAAVVWSEQSSTDFSSGRGWNDRSDWILT